MVEYTSWEQEEEEVGVVVVDVLLELLEYEQIFSEEHTFFEVGEEEEEANIS